ncbi:MAG TPA: DUF4160 domain-containing protein [Dehalococcoidia bacterium]|nr:DUF4160 domain-containing protein [Dehalococcoidia bacterium]
MPTVLRFEAYRFFFYSADGDEPPHIHVERGAGHAKYWLEPVRLQGSSGFRPAELRRIARLVEDNVASILRAWHEHFGNRST